MFPCDTFLCKLNVCYHYLLNIFRFCREIISVKIEFVNNFFAKTRNVQKIIIAHMIMKYFDPRAEVEDFFKTKSWDLDQKVTFDEFRGERLHIEKLFRSMDKNNDGWVAREVMNSIQIQSRLVLNKNKLNYKTDIITSTVQSVSP